MDLVLEEFFGDVSGMICILSKFYWSAVQVAVYVTVQITTGNTYSKMTLTLPVWLGGCTVVSPASKEVVKGWFCSCLIFESVSALAYGFSR
jgi:hypothetical protein